jgi:hypothetical protein
MKINVEKIKVMRISRQPSLVLTLYGAEIWTFWKTDIPWKFYNVLLEKISWNDRVKNEEVLHTETVERILKEHHTYSKTKDCSHRA